MHQVTTEFLEDVYNALLAEAHIPNYDPECGGCRIMAQIEKMLDMPPGKWPDAPCIVTLD